MIPFPIGQYPAAALRALILELMTFGFMGMTVHHMHQRRVLPEHSRNCLVGHIHQIHGLGAMRMHAGFAGAACDRTAQLQGQGQEQPFYQRVPGEFAKSLERHIVRA